MAYRYNIEPFDDRLTKLRKAQEGTIEEAKDILSKHQICLIVRPTGFGKTHMMLSLANRMGYKRVLYLYPIDVIKQSIIDNYNEKVFTLDKQRKDIMQLEFCSYRKMLIDATHIYRQIDIIAGKRGKIKEINWVKLSESEKLKQQRDYNNLSEKEVESLKRLWFKYRFSDIDLVILDEAHMVGAEGFTSYWKYIKELVIKPSKNNRLHILGGTATPLRTVQDKDIMDIFSYELAGEKRDAVVSSLNINDCWKLGLIKRPYYAKSILNKEYEHERILNILKGSKQSKAELNDISDNLYNILNEIKPLENLLYKSINHINSFSLRDKEYMRFLVFYQNSKKMVESYEEINKALEKAFQEYSLNAYYITSEIEYLRLNNIPISKVDIISKIDKGLDEGNNFGYKQLDIIHSIDMLNLGYHVDKVTGVIINRSTGSEIVYYQQIGRCISVMSDRQPLIIDLQNADAKLLNKTFDSEREQAVQNIKQFISGCEQDELQNEAVNKIYSYTGMYLDTEHLSDDFIEYWYFDRKAPIYYLWSISKSLGKKELLKNIIVQIYNICKRSGREELFKLDYEVYNNKQIEKFNKNIISTIKKEREIVNMLKIRKRG